MPTAIRDASPTGMAVLKTLVPAILAVAATSSLLGVAHADIMQATMPERTVSRAARLHSADGSDPDTVWIGHIDDAGYTAGGKMVAGGYGPYHVGRGPNRPKRAGAPVTIGDNGTWSWDRYQPGETDSLQGWWPLARPFQSGATTFGDFRRAFMGLDYGNQVNYVENVGVAQKRTFGVVGLWHRDRGNTPFVAADTMRDVDPVTGGVQDEITNVQPVLWSPTEVGGAGSTASAWMGIRSHGDYSHRDDVARGGTGNYFNADVLQFQGNNGFNHIGSVHANGTDHNFPGYGSQLDQMLYRDVHVNEGGGLNVSFNFSTNMSLSKNTTAGVAIGWFDKDPISNAQVGVGAPATPSNDGNFIGAMPGGTVSPNAPCDSFMVYIGAPVNDNNVVFTDDLELNTGSGLLTITTVYDKRRRWFSEVLRCTNQENAGAGKVLYKELGSYAGFNPPTAVGPIDVKALYPTLYNHVCALDGAGNGGTFRLVFRVHTNRAFDDENAGNPAASFNSGTRGAAILDNVVVNGWDPAEGNFENENAGEPGVVNNDVAVPATAAWKSTGKPPAVYFHLHPLATLAFNDPCGSVDNPNRQCNLYGNITTAGDHDAAGDKEGGVFGSNTQDRERCLATPTINLRSTGNGQYNAMGIDAEIATVNEYNVMCSLFNGGLVNATTASGNFIRSGWQSYPARQVNGNLTWGEARSGASVFFYGTRGCFETLVPGAAAIAGSLIRTSNASGIPDSLRAYIHRLQRCYTFTLTDVTCSPTTPPNTGVYFDNVSICLIDAPPPPGIAISIWDLIQDAFPANGNDALVPADFDTCAAQIRSGLNRAAGIGSTSRPAITGDTTVVTAGGNGKRLDMIFRILPGVGNYVTKGNRASGVSKRPDVAVPVAATSSDGTFFGEYMANAGAFASDGSHLGHEGNWSPHKWNSARMDTVENNLFPTANNNSQVGLSPGIWAGMYHESDPHYLTLGIRKWRCAMTNPAGLTNSTNIACGGQDGTISSPPTAPPSYAAYGVASGFPAAGAEFPGSQSGETREYTKILPDGLLTPGAHVEYFFRKSDAPAGLTSVELGPDTNFVFQGSEANSDGHRWQEFGVLPDRWKDGAWAAAYQDANAPACMLYIDWEDRRGDERFWVGIADTIGATLGSYNGSGYPTGRWGAHNGWHAPGTQAGSDVISGDKVGQDPTIAVYKHGGQPGTIWDMYGVKASESSTTGVSLASRTTTNPGGFQTGKKNLNGPSAKMLRTYYRVLLILTGDLNGGPFGPYADRGDNDLGLLQDFATTVDGTTRPRGVWAQGRGFVEGFVHGGTLGGPVFTTTYFGAGLASGDYRSYAGNSNDVPDLFVFAPVHAPVAPNVSPTGPYGVLSSCVITNDVLTLSGSFGAAMAAKYEDTSTNPNPKIASIYAPSSLPGTSDHPMVTLVDGFRIQSLGTPGTLQSGGLMLYYWHVMMNAFGSLNCTTSQGQPVAVGDGPNGLVNFLALRSENPFRSDVARIEFGLIRTEHVTLRLYDVSGRLVKTLANREYKAGQHPVFWDGTNDDGERVSRGVYFYQLRTPSFASDKKLVVLKE